MSGIDFVRNGKGDPMITPLDGGPPKRYGRISALGGELDNGYGLMIHNVRHAVLGVARHPDLAAVAAACNYGDDKLDAVIETAKDRGGANGKANWGTAVHLFTDPDPTPYVPESMRDAVLAYAEALDVAGITVLSAEQHVVNDAMGVAGTYDAVVDVPGWGMMILDKKTGRLNPHKEAVQLAAYATAVHYNPATEGRTPLDVRTDVGLIAHIPRDAAEAGAARCDLHLVDLNAGWYGAQLALEVRAYRTRKDIARPFLPGECDPRAGQKTDPVTAQRIPAAIAEAKTLDQLQAIYFACEHAWTSEHTQLAAARRAVLGV